MDDLKFGAEDARGYWKPIKSISYGPFFEWPPKPKALFKWFFGFPFYYLSFNNFPFFYSFFFNQVKLSPLHKTFPVTLLRKLGQTKHGTN